MKNSLMLIMCLLITYACGFSQNRCGVPSRDIVFLDTVAVSDPIILKFVQESEVFVTRTGYLLVPKCVGDTATIGDGLEGFHRCLATIGYLFCSPGLFRSFINNALYFNPEVPDVEFLNELSMTMTMREKDTVYLDFDQGRKYVPDSYQGLESFEIRQRRFWLFLVKNSLIVSSSSDEELTIEGEGNIYLRVLVPITR